MKIKNTSVSLATVILVLASGLPLTAVAGHTYQTANIFDLSTGFDVAGAGTLTRTLESATARIYTTGLDKKAAYTIWWVVWNDPSQCVGICGDEDADFGVPGNSVFYAGGFVTGNDGSANVSVHVEAGDQLSDIADGVVVLIPGGLEVGHGFLAEIHVVIRTHGKIIVGTADLQIGSFDGGCPPNTCEDTHGAVFAPVL